jgi:hypothetical protein
MHIEILPHKATGYEVRVVDGRTVRHLGLCCDLSVTRPGKERTVALPTQHKPRLQLRGLCLPQSVITLVAA